MSVMEVPAKELRKGDVLCTQVDRQDVSRVSTVNAWRIQSKTFQILWTRFAWSDASLDYFLRVKDSYRLSTYTVESSKRGFRRVRIVMGTGIVIRVPLNMPIAVHRGK